MTINDLTNNIGLLSPVNQLSTLLRENNNSSSSNANTNNNSNLSSATPLIDNN